RFRLQPRTDAGGLLSATRRRSSVSANFAFRILLRVFAFSLLPPPENPMAPVVEDRIAHRSNQKAEQKTEQLSAYDDLCHRGTPRTAWPSAQRDRDHRGDQQDRGHQDRAQPNAIRLQDGLIPRDAAS